MTSGTREMLAATFLHLEKILSQSELGFHGDHLPTCPQIHSLTFSGKIYFPGSLANYLLIRFHSWQGLAGDWSREEDRELLPLSTQPHQWAGAAL